MNKCANCDKSFFKRHQIKFCSNRCQSDFQYASYIRRWKNGDVNGNIGVTSGNISAHIKRYMLEKFDRKCSVCKWSMVNPTTGVVPLEIDHVDGNAENSKEDNLKLLCPNCHSLTPYYKNLNRGKGRKWRMRKYVKNQ